MASFVRSRTRTGSRCSTSIWLDVPAARAALRGMMKRGRPHHRHHLGGRRHRQSGAGQLHRDQGRHDRHVQSLRERSGERGITAIAWPPGSSRGHDRRAATRSTAKRFPVPQGRLVAAPMPSYLASDEAAHVTGQTLGVRRHGDDTTIGGGGEISDVSLASLWLAKPDEVCYPRQSLAGENRMGEGDLRSAARPC